MLSLLKQIWHNTIKFGKLHHKKSLTEKKLLLNKFQSLLIKGDKI